MLKTHSAKVQGTSDLSFERATQLASSGFVSSTKHNAQCFGTLSSRLLDGTLLVFDGIRGQRGQPGCVFFTHKHCV